MCRTSICSALTLDENDTDRLTLLFLSEFLTQFNPFYYYYNPEHSSKALDRQLQLKRMAKERQLCPPPELPKLRETFANLPAFIATPAVVKAILCTLER